MGARGMIQGLILKGKRPRNGKTWVVNPNYCQPRLHLIQRRTNVIAAGERETAGSFSRCHEPSGVNASQSANSQVSSVDWRPCTPPYPYRYCPRNASRAAAYLMQESSPSKMSKEKNLPSSEMGKAKLSAGLWEKGVQ